MGAARHAEFAGSRRALCSTCTLLESPLRDDGAVFSSVICSNETPGYICFHCHPIASPESSAQTPSLVRRVLAWRLPCQRLSALFET